jgi:type IV pilus assembly protein PilF
MNKMDINSSAIYKFIVRGLFFISIAMLCISCVTETTKDGKPYEASEAKKPDAKGALDDYVMLAQGYLEDGDRESAMRAINKGLAIDSDSVEMINVLAFYYSTAGESDLAEKEFRRAISIDANKASSFLNYGAFLFGQNRISEACDMFERATKDVLYRKRDDAFVNYGKCMLKVGKNAEAEKAFERALMQNFRNSQAQIQLAFTNFKKGNFLLSQRYYDSYLAAGRQTPETLWLGIRLAHVAGDQDKLASYALLLKNQYSSSKEYSEYSNWVATK